MLNRRQYFSVDAESAATFARTPGTSAAQASRYDLMIKGGRVIDPSVRLDAIRDVAISGGRIASVEASITAEAAETIGA
jgi:dihydroorotase